MGSVYKVIDVVGTSEVSWEDAAKKAIEVAGGSLDHLRIAEVTRMDIKIDGDKPIAFRTRLNLSFKYQGERD